MGVELLISLLAGLLSMAAGSVLSTPSLEKLLRRLFKIPQRTPSQTYAQRLAGLTESLRKSSQDVDAIVQELSSVAQEREAAVRKLEGDLGTLAAREQELQKRVNELQNLPLSVAEQFAALTTVSEKRSARRDYVLFGFGVLVSTLLSIIFFLLQR